MLMLSSTKNCSSVGLFSNGQRCTCGKRSAFVDITGHRKSAAATSNAAGIAITPLMG